ncbi:MAG: hypothetical protein HC836_34795 [Richelia sp. RM2_1_2]|nr:hypothetical protein [Richelia sp. RM2_1_2]
MSKILFITVGGSFQPIVTSIRSLQPDRVIFIASDGEKGSKSQVIGQGTPCEIRRGAEVVEKLPNIPTQLELGDSFQKERDLILVENPDDLNECYTKIHPVIRNLQQKANHEIMADYTGGTKSLSAALVMAAIDCGVSLYVNIAARDNLIKVEQGQVTQKVNTNFRCY